MAKGFKKQSQEMSKNAHNRLPAKKARIVLRDTNGVWTHDELKILAKGGKDAVALRESKPWKDGKTRQDKYLAKKEFRRQWNPVVESQVEIIG